MSRWRMWQVSAIAEWRSALCPCLIRFVYGGLHEEKVPPSVFESPAKLFPSFWANVACFSDRERDFFLQCVEYVHNGVGMRLTPRVVRAVDRLTGEVAAAPRGCCGAPTAVCDVVLMPDGRPCTGWFLDNFEYDDYAAVIAALEERWRVSPAALWALKERGISEEFDSMTFWNKQDILLRECMEWPLERLRHHVSKHVSYVDRNASSFKGSVSGVHSLSLSLLNKPASAGKELIFPLIKGLVDLAEGSNMVNNAGYSTLCRSFGCLLSLESSAVLDPKVRASGELLCSLKSDNVATLAYQQLLRHSLDVIDGKRFIEPAQFISSALKEAVRDLSEDWVNVDRLLALFPIVIALSLVAFTPRERDKALCTALMAVAFIDNYVSAYEISLLQQHVSFEKPMAWDEKGISRGALGLVDCAVLDRVLCDKNCATSFASDLQALVADFPMTHKAWMPGVGLDSSFYVSNLLNACDVLAGMLNVPGSMEATQHEAQRAVYRLRHKLRVHVFRRFGFVAASKMWGSTFASRALPFLNALRVSLLPTTNVAIFRFRNALEMPHAFAAADEPSHVLHSFALTNLSFPGSSPLFCVECGTVQELEELANGTGNRRRLRCSFSFSSSSSNFFSDLVFEFLPGDGVFSLMASTAVKALQNGPETRFVDLAVHVEEGRVAARLVSPAVAFCV